MSDIGHNSGHEEPNEGQLLAFVERIERLEEEKKALADDICDIYAETKSMGFEPKIIRKIVAMRKKDPDKRREEEIILDLYMAKLGMLSDLPLGQAAISHRLKRSA